MRYLFRVHVIFFCQLVLFSSVANAISLSEDQVDSAQIESEIIDLIKSADLYIYDDPVRALEFSESAYSKAVAYKEDSLLAATLNNLGAVRWSLGNVKHALAVFQYSIKISSENGYMALLAKNFGNLGNVYSSANMYFDAINYYKKELELHENLPDNQFRKFALNNNIGRAFQQVNLIDSSMLYFDRAEQLRDSSFVQHFSIYFFNVAEALVKGGDVVQADSLLQLSLASATQYEATRTIIRINWLLAEIELGRRNLEKAFDYALLAVEQAEESKKKELLMLTHRTLANCYAEMGDYENAYTHEKIHERYLEELQGTDMVTELELLAFEQRRNQLSTLGAETQDSRKVAQQNRIAVVFLFACLIAAFFFLATSVRRGRQLKAKSLEMVELNDFKNRLFAVVSHDIKSPIQSITMVVDLLESKMVSEEDLEMLLPDIKRKIVRLNDLLDNLFQWAQGKLSNQSFGADEIDIKAMVEELQEEMSERLSNKKINIFLNVIDGFNLRSDANILKIVLRNLIVNAIKFSYSNSKISISAFSSGKNSVVDVRDNGIGMSEDAIEGLFSMEIASKDGTQGEKGNGLGLILCNDFVQGLGGKIDVESELGEGSNFRIILPR